MQGGGLGRYGGGSVGAQPPHHPCSTASCTPPLLFFEQTRNLGKQTGRNLGILSRMTDTTLNLSIGFCFYRSLKFDDIPVLA